MKEETVRTPKRRSIRSFVRRTGRLTPSQQRAIDELWPQYGVAFGNVLLDWGEVFGRDAPRVLEIGFGNGESLVRQAADNPDTDYFGIEVHEPGIGHCLIRAREAGIRNLRLACHDAVEVMTEQVAASSLSRVNLYFPDPWPKKRHHKRRIVQPPFLALVAKSLCPGGTLQMATDWENYAEHIDETLAACAEFTLRERRVHDGDDPLDRPATKFERRGLRHGHRIVDWCYVCTK